MGPILHVATRRSPPRRLLLARHNASIVALPRAHQGAMTSPDATAAVPAAGYSPLSDRDAATTAAPVDRERSLAQRVGFRFAFVYLLLYTFPGPVNELPFTDFIGDTYSAIWKAVVPWFGAHVLHLAHPVSVQPSGSGDKLFDWVQVLVMLTLAVIAAGVWTALARGKRSHPKLLEAFALYLRFTLARTMFSYGFDKIFPNQFTPMNPARLTQYIGEASPGGFAWTFLG